MVNKAVIEQIADAAIVQHGTEKERTELRGRIQSFLDNHSLYNRNNIEDVLFYLKTIKLGEGELLNDLQKYIQDERALKGGNAGEEFERHFGIIETYVLKVQQAQTNTQAAANEVVDSSKEDLKSLLQNPPIPPFGTPAPSVPGQGRAPGEKISEGERKRKFNEKFLKSRKDRIEQILKRDLGDTKIQEYLNEIQKNPSQENVEKLQKHLNKTRKTLEPDGMFGERTLGVLEEIMGAEMAKNENLGKPSVPEAAPAAAAAVGTGSVAVAGTAAAAATPSSNQGTSTPSPASKPDAGISPTLSSGSEYIGRGNFGKFEKLYTEFSASIAPLRSLSEYIPSMDSTIQEKSRKLQAVKTQLRKEAESIQGKNLSIQEYKKFQEMCIAIAKFYSGEGMVNRHNLDYIEAEFFIRKALEAEFEQKKINLPNPPTEADIKKSHPELFTQIKNLGAKGYSLSEILSNPRISGEFNKAYEELYGIYKKNVQGILMGENTKFKEGKSHYESAASVEALRLYVDMVGAGGIFDLSSENTDFMKRVGGQAGIIIASILATGGASLPVAIGSAAALGAGGEVLASGRMDPKNIAFAAASNAVPLGAGKAFSTLTTKSAGAGLSTVSGYVAAEAGMNVAIGAGLEQAHAYVQGYHLDLEDSIKNNLAWALLPLYTHRNLLKNYIKPSQEVRELLEQIKTTKERGGDITALKQQLAQKVQQHHGAVQHAAANEHGNNNGHGNAGGNHAPNHGANHAAGHAEHGGTKLSYPVKFATDFVRMKRMDTFKQVGIVTNTVRAPLMAAKELIFDSIRDVRLKQVLEAAARPGFTNKLGGFGNALAGFLGDGVKIALTGSLHTPNWYYGLMNVIAMSAFTLQHEYKNKSPNFSNMEGFVEFMEAYLETQFIHIPRTFLKAILGENFYEDITKGLEEAVGKV